MDLFLTLIIVFVLAPMILGPFVIKFSHWVSAKVTIKSVSPEALDHDVKAFLDNAMIEFESIGFDFVGYMELCDYVPNMLSSYFALFMDKQNKTSSMAAVLRPKSGRTVRYYEFTNKYSNGRVINVNNSPMMGSYIHPDRSSYRYPDTDSIKHLYEINNWVTSRDKRAINPMGYVRGRELEMLCDAFNNETRLQEKLGYLYLTENKTRFMLTWKGAFIMTEKNVFPIRNILAFLDLRSAKNAIAGLPFSRKV
ncbi:MAG: hypothetical protein AABZ15_04570 [Nitrospirota bacterium]